MAGLFLTYRQQDQPMVAAALDFLLAGHFGRDQVFRDCVSVPPGADYAREIEQRLAAAEVLVVVIGPGWLAATVAGGRLIDRPADWVRREVRSALRCGIMLVPLLLDDTPPLLPADLPADIRALARCQAVRIRHTSFEPDYLGLVRQLERYVLPDRSAPEPGRDPGVGPAGVRTDPAAARLAGRTAVSLAAFVLPTLAAWAVAGGPRPVSLLLGLLALASAAALAMFLLGVLLVYANRGWSDRVDRQLTALPPAGRHAAAFGLLVATLGGLMLLLVDRGRGGLATGWLPLLFAAAIVTVAWAALRWLRQHPVHEPWPPPEVRPEPAAIRRALAQLTDRLTCWPAPLSRSRREHAVDALHQVEHAVDALAGLAAGTRRTWLRVDSRRPTAGYAVWLTGTAGLLAGAAVFARLAGGAGDLIYPALAAALVGVAVIGAVTTELRYRHHRWLQGVVVAESRIELRRLHSRLAELTGERPGPAAQE